MKVDYIIRLVKSNGMKNMSNTSDDDIIDYINLAFIELSKRFNLFTEEAILTLGDNLVYTLPNEVMYLQDAYGDVSKELKINDEDDNAVFTISPFQVLVTPGLPDTKISLIYAAAPKIIVDRDEEIELSRAMLEALLHYVAFQAKSSIDASVNAENNAHWLRFEASCKNILELGLYQPNGMYYKGVKNVYV